MKIIFREGDFGGSIAAFVVDGCGIPFSVIARRAGKTIKFDLIDDIGQKRTLSEEQFKESYPREFDEYSKKLDAWEKSVNKEEKEVSSISDKTHASEDIKDEKSFDVDGQIFCVRLLEDDLVDNYAEVLFKNDDHELNKTTYYKVLAILDDKNPNVVRLNYFNDNGEELSPMLPSRLEEEEPEMFSRLIRALKEMGKKMLNSQNTM